MRVWWILLIGGILAGSGAAQPMASAPPGDFAEFVAFCDYSHRAPNDPIVFPGGHHASHMHDFFGSTVTDHDTTVEELLAGPTTCDPLADRSAYWVATLYDAAGQPVDVEHATFYYTLDISDPRALRSFPLGLKIIAGSATASAPPAQPRYKWSCLGSPVSSTSEIVVCPAGSKLELLLDFPDCWDGANLDSPNHQSHMAYSAGGACPASHPASVPLLQFKLRYEQPGTPGMRLSSGAGYTAHGDFFNAWEPAALDRRVLICLRLGMRCGPAGPSSQFLPLTQR